MFCINQAFGDNFQTTALICGFLLAAVGGVPHVLPITVANCSLHTGGVFF